jgi:hypothetical protein
LFRRAAENAGGEFGKHFARSMFLALLLTDQLDQHACRICCADSPRLNENRASCMFL